ncbi:MAG TPA: PEP-CTERM sorting domain-containing protein [Tepidisphaeraceae bacterium]|nr:PEP-CTERM sorting domain-containing protein [Tepidisphaeraceae bacterium]
MRNGKLLAVLGALAVGAGSADGGVIYTEAFTTEGSNRGHNSIGWEAYSSGGAGAVTNNGTSTTGALFVATSTGSDGTAGIGAKQTTGVVGLVYTSEFGAVGLGDLTNLGFHSNNSSGTGGSYRIVVRVDTANTLLDPSDDAWYASEATYTSSGGLANNWTTNPSAGVHDLAYAPAAAGWRALTFVPTGAGQQITLGTAGSVASDLTGTLTAAGLYMNANTATTLRYDTFQVSAVPEPASVAALGIVGMALLGRRRRA